MAELFLQVRAHFKDAYPPTT